MAHPPQKYFVLRKSDANDWTEEWFSEIGLVGYYFGQLEWVTYLLCDRVGGSETEMQELLGRPFAKRCDFAKKELLPKIADPALRQEWEDALKEVRECGKMRNDIVHNPVELNIDEIATHGIKIGQGIHLLQQGGQTLGLGDVQQFSRSTRELHKRILDLLARTPAAV